MIMDKPVNFNFDEIYALVESQKELTKLIGPPVDLNDKEYNEYLKKLKDNQDYAFCMVVDLRIQEIVFQNRIKDVLGVKTDTLKGFLKLMHTAYLEEFLKWGGATIKTVLELKESVKPLEIAHQITIPLKGNDGKYYWYQQRGKAIRVDKDGQMVSHINTYHYDGELREDNLKYLEPIISYKGKPKKEWEELIRLNKDVIGEFTKAEIKVMELYAKGYKNAKEIAESTSRKVSVIREHNANIKRKGERIFKVKFTDAKNVALSCKDKGYIYNNICT